jgi:hypothetical protein
VLAVFMSVVVALSAHAHAGQRRADNFPTRGKVVPGKTIGGISLGMTEAQVKAHWGGNYVIGPQPVRGYTTWLYEYRGAEPLGAAVKFQNNKVVAVFTLGSPAGWGLSGAMMGDPISNVYNVFGSTGQANCIGYDALTVRIGPTTTSFYSAAGVIYGYALTAASQPACQ